MVEAIGTANEVRVLVFEVAAVGATNPPIQIGKKLVYQRQASRTAGKAEFVADDLSICLGAKRIAFWIWRFVKVEYWLPEL